MLSSLGAFASLLPWQELLSSRDAVPRLALEEQRKLREEADRQAYQLQQQQEQERLAFEQLRELQEEADRQAYQLQQQQEQERFTFEKERELQEEADRQAYQLRQQQEQERLALEEQRLALEEADRARAHQLQQEKEAGSQPMADFDFNTMPTLATANLARPSLTPIFNPFATPITAANPAVLSLVPPIQFGTSTSPRPTVNPISFGLKGPSVPTYPSDIDSPKLIVESSFLSGEALKTVNDCKYEHVGWKVKALVQNRSADKLAEAKAAEELAAEELAAEAEQKPRRAEEADRLYCQSLAATLMAENARLDAEAAQGYEERLSIPDVPPTPDFSHGSGIVPVDEEDDLEAMWHMDAAEEAAAAAAATNN
ncbi:hypothetical protein B0T26DRAFT_745624 [Lasiosphaeria miniovina]|uniref:Uncharacterized protein n=1 Tax=Lasiosphaeria miniovina TaxID=1954250 RepID=A0AA40BG27_9PEZI|nr:uncharacterized protein B0T26DRAFT_745624 [Lasiosphaeria miniovina]KAK0733592.1 hypothetical protein B0T26DRAFT_745624 [Lasiosphaeria miniovina]